MKTIIYQMDQISIKAVVFLGLLLIGFIFKADYGVSNLYFVVGMVLVLIAILSILINAHLFSGWKLNGNRKNTEFVEDVEDAKAVSKKEQAQKIAGQKNEPLKLSTVARLALNYGLILIISSVIVSFF